MTLGNKIRKYRQLRGLTQKELGLMAALRKLLPIHESENMKVMRWLLGQLSGKN